MQRAMGETLHQLGKVHTWNPYAPRADFMLHTDGVFSEDSYMDERMHLHGMLGVGGKPVLTWNPGCESWPSSQCGRYKDSADNGQLLSRLLHYGVQPMLPMAGNDHAITRFVAEHGGKNGTGDVDAFMAFGPLFRAIRGRTWVFTARAAELTSGSAAVNIFSVSNGSRLALALTLGQAGTTATVAVKSAAKIARVVAAADGATATLTSGVVKVTFGSRGAVVVVMDKTDEALSLI